MAGTKKEREADSKDLYGLFLVASMCGVLLLVIAGFHALELDITGIAHMFSSTDEPHADAATYDAGPVGGSDMPNAHDNQVESDIVAVNSIVGDVSQVVEGEHELELDPSVEEGVLLEMEGSNLKLKERWGRAMAANTDMVQRMKVAKQDSIDEEGYEFYMNLAIFIVLFVAFWGPSFSRRIEPTPGEQSQHGNGVGIPDLGEAYNEETARVLWNDVQVYWEFDDTFLGTLSRSDFNRKKRYFRHMKFNYNTRRPWHFMFHFKELATFFEEYSANATYKKTARNGVRHDWVRYENVINNEIK
jgi:hypothetical protein